MSLTGSERRFWAITAVVMGVISLANYLPVFRGQVPFPRDVAMQHSAWDGQPRSSPHQQVANLIDIVAMFYPFRALAARGAHEGSLPLWNPYIMSGAPFEANAQSALFSPFAPLYYVLPLKAAWTATLLMRVFLAGLFMALFVRQIGASGTGSIVSGILFALCAFTVQWQGMSNGDSGIWLPLICYSLVRLHRQADRRSVAIAAFAFAMPVLAGHPETAAHSTLMALAMAVFLWFQQRRKSFVIAFVIAGFLGVGLASVQVIPTVEWLGLLGPQLDNPQPVLDRHQGQGFFSRDILRDPSSAGISVPEGAAYVGMLGLLAASLAPFHKSRSYALFFAALAIVATAVAFGFQPVRWIVVHLPVIKAMKNARLILVANLAVAALAGLGISALEQQIQTDASRKRALIYVVIASLVAGLGIYEVHRATWVPVEFMRSPAGSLIFLLIALALIAARLSGRLSPRVFPTLICGWCAIEMLSFSYGYLGFTPADEVFPPAPVLDFLAARSDLKDYRVAKDRFPIPHDAGMIYGFEAADGYDITTERARNFTADLAEDRPDGVMFLAEKILQSHDRRFDMLNVKYLLVTTPSPPFEALRQSERFAVIYQKGSVAVLENRSVLPRILVVPASGIELIPGLPGQLDRLKQPSFDPQRFVVVSDSSAGLHDAAGHDDGKAKVEVVERTLNSFRFKVQSDGPSVAVISQMYYPGWKATINGIDAAVHSVDYALTGVFIPQGSSDVRLFFRPFSFELGAGISIVSLAIILLLCFSQRKETNHGLHGFNG
jgi:hypothetical protein